jgi:hypothetical protein
MLRNRLSRDQQGAITAALRERLMVGCRPNLHVLSHIPTSRYTNLRTEWARTCAEVGLGSLELVKPEDGYAWHRYNGLIVHDCGDLRSCERWRTGTRSNEDFRAQNTGCLRPLPYLVRGRPDQRHAQS